MVPGYDAFVEGSVIQRGQNPRYGLMLHDRRKDHWPNWFFPSTLFLPLEIWTAWRLDVTRGIQGCEHRAQNPPEELWSGRG